MCLIWTNLPGDEEVHVDNWSGDDWSDTESVSVNRSKPAESDVGHPKEDSRTSSFVLWIIGFMIIFQARHVISDTSMEALLSS